MPRLLLQRLGRPDLLPALTVRGGKFSVEFVPICDIDGLDGNDSVSIFRHPVYRFYESKFGYDCRVDFACQKK
jgi:hypothetical protein